MLLAALVLAGCTSPRYQSAPRYEPPQGAAGQACLAGCERGLEACRTRCRTAYQACLREVEPEAQAHYAALLERYEALLDGYRAALDRYRMDLWVGWGHDPWWLGSGWYGPWYRPYYFPGPPPAPPDRDAELSRYQHTACRRSCGCQPEYDACYLGCGGRKFVERRCLSDCPEPGEP